MLRVWDCVQRDIYYRYLYIVVKGRGDGEGDSIAVKQEAKKQKYTQYREENATKREKKNFDKVKEMY
jgi:hypothetical protein